MKLGIVAELTRIIENLVKTPANDLAQAQAKTRAMRCRVHGKAASLGLRTEAGQTMMAITTCCSGFQKEVADLIFHKSTS